MKTQDALAIVPEVETGSTEVPSKLFHYTDAAGFLGILEHREIWATDVRCMNDAEEIEYAAKFVSEKLRGMGDELLNGCKEEVRCYSEFRSFSEWKRAVKFDDENVRDEIKFAGLFYMLSDGYENVSQYNGKSKEKGFDTYAACFSSDSDLLGQWRGYAGSQGFSIGFRVDKLSAITVGAECAIIGEPKKVSYGEEAGNKNFRDFLTELAGGLSSVIDAAKGGPNKSWNMNFPSTAALATIKHGAFMDEREWRLIVNSRSEPGDGTPDFRAGGVGSLLPFLRLQLPDDCIESVRVGPGPEAALRVSMAEKALARFGHHGVEVTTSEAPYRP